MSMLNVLQNVQLPEMDCLSFAAIAGSHSYGTQRERSDLDVRGFFMGSPRNLLLRKNDEVVTAEDQDMTFWPLHKFLGFLIDGRPTALELLFTREQDRLVYNKFGRMVLENRTLFLSQRAINAYQGYIDRTYGDLMRMISRDCPDEQAHLQRKKEMLEGAADSLKRRFADQDCQLSVSEGGILLDLSVRDYPLLKFSEDLTAVQSMLRAYSAAYKKSSQLPQDIESVNKTACHCIRLMGELTELASTGSFFTYRVGKPEYKLLRGALEGQYQMEDGSFDFEGFSELIRLMREDMRYAVEHTCLPAEVDYGKIQELEYEMVSEYVRNYLS